jgi:phosphotransferase system HPr-like phosphotransfer protein
MLGAGIESELEITAEGDMAEAALDALTRLVADKFGENA